MNVFRYSALALALCLCLGYTNVVLACVTWSVQSSTEVTSNADGSTTEHTSTTTKRTGIGTEQDDTTTRETTVTTNADGSRTERETEVTTGVDANGKAENNSRTREKTTKQDENGNDVIDEKTEVTDADGKTDTTKTHTDTKKYGIVGVTETKTKHNDEKELTSSTVKMNNSSIKSKLPENATPKQSAAAESNNNAPIQGAMQPPEGGTTRLHSDLLTEASPAAWWAMHRGEVIRNLRSEAKSVEQYELLEISREDFDALNLKLESYSIASAGELKEWLGLFNYRLAFLDCRDYAAKSGLSCSATAVQNIGNAWTNYLTKYTADMDTKADPADLYQGLYDGMYGALPQRTELADKMFNGLGHDAFLEVARERLMMAALYKQYPERVAIDAILNIIYLNAMTARSLPPENFSFFYAKFDLHFKKAAEECKDILRDIGKPALPYLERAIVELDGKVYIPRKDRTQENAFSVERIESDPNASGVPLCHQLIPMATDIGWVFKTKAGEAMYDSPFYKNPRVEETLRDLYFEISGK